MKHNLISKLTLFAALVVGLCTLPRAHAQVANNTLRVVAHADLKILDPTFTTAYISRNFGHMVYDTLFAMNSKNEPVPQMVQRFSSSADGLKWSFTLRPGQKFSDGTAVRAADAVASLIRWSSRDSLGRAMNAAGAQWRAEDDLTLTLTLRQPFGMVLDALAKSSGFPPFVLPERLAKAPTTSPLAEAVGSGPFLFKRDEWAPGNKVVFVKNPGYVGPQTPPDGLAGNKTPKLERVEWLYLPDSNSAVSALRRGEVDYIEQVPPDYIGTLKSDPQTQLLPSGAWQGFFVMNHLHPPFDKPEIRRAVLSAVEQEKFTAAMGYPTDFRVAYCASYFICGGPNESAAGSEQYRKVDLERARKALLDAGYKGEKVVLLVPSDIAILNGAALMAAQTLKNIGFNVEAQTMDWATISARRTKRDVPTSGGWSAYVTVGGRFDVDSPVNNAYLGAACGNSLPGWPCDQQLDALRTAWIAETDPAKRKARLDAFHARAYEAVPYVSLGQYTSAMAVNKRLKGADKLWSGLPNVWILDK